MSARGSGVQKRKTEYNKLMGKRPGIKKTLCSVPASAIKAETGILNGTAQTKLKCSPYRNQLQSMPPLPDEKNDIMVYDAMTQNPRPTPMVFRSHPVFLTYTPRT